MNVLILLFSSVSFAATSPASLSKGAPEVKKALEKYHADCGQYPSIEQGLNALLHKPKELTCEKSKTYLKKTPKDYWGRPWIYESDGQSYTFTSLGADGKNGGEGSDKDIVIRSATPAE